MPDSVSMGPNARRSAGQRAVRHAGVCQVTHPDAHHPPPDAGYYRPLYGGWWVHRALGAGGPAPRASGLFHAGYWEPIDNRPGHVWIPGWFDGTRWISGYWVTVEEYDAADPESWRPTIGWDEAQAPASSPTSEPPLAIPID